jgi:ankyrin repeat protein
MSCQGASDGGKKKEETKKESLQMTDEIVQVQIGPAEQEAFRQAAHDGDLEKVKTLQKQGVAYDVVDQDGHTALMFAAFNGHSEIVIFLLDAGAEINLRDYLDRTALLYASTGPFPETVKILLDRGADPNVVDSDEHFSPLMHAAAEGHLDVVKVLIANGADKSLKDVDGDDASSFATQGGHMKVAEYLNALQ